MTVSTMVTTRLLTLFVLVGAAVAWVDLDPDLIPTFSEPLPVYSLGPPSFLPDEWLESVLGHAGSELNFTRANSDDPKVYIYDGDEIVGFIDEETGETRVFPDYGTLEPCTEPIDVGQALSFFDQGTEAFPSDDTGIELVQGSSLQGSELGDGTPPDDSGSNYRRSNDTVASGDLTFLTLGTIQRSVTVGDQTFPVCGPGSQASFGVGPDNRVVSLVYQWKPATKTGRTHEALPVDKVAKHIQDALEKKVVYAEGSGIKVYHIDTCFYDSGVEYLQPVYRVLAEPYDLLTNTTAADVKKFIEYIPVGGEAAEDIGPSTGGGPSFAGDEPPLEPQDNQVVARSFLNYFEARQELVGPTVTVGRYVVRNDSDGFVDDAKNFWSNLASSPSIKFVNHQYYWAYPWLYNDSSAFVNSVDLALTEAHGGFHVFSTYKGSASIKDGGVRIPAGLPSDGFGRISDGGRGKLSYWLIDACEVIPTVFDFEAVDDLNPTRSAFDPWWPVFRGGIHAVVGWRTSALFEDNTAANTAAAIALGRPVVSAWLDAAHSDPAYKNRPTYTGGGTGIEDWPFGRAAAVFRCGRASDKVTDRQDLGAPTCLSIRYWNND